MKLKILDTVTGATVEVDDGFSEFWWAEGNGSCDCNRERYFLPEEEWQHRLDKPTCSGCERYLIIEADNNEYTLQELNLDYPVKLLRKHGVIK